MAKCAHCITQETELYENGTPICLACATDKDVQRVTTNGTSHKPLTNHKPPATEREIGASLLQSMLSAVSRNDEAANEFDHAVSQARTGAHHQDGAQRIRDASSKLSQTREEMMAAHNRLSNFVERGIVPEDMKRTG